MNPDIDLGAMYLGDGLCRFRVWAPLAHKVEVHIVWPDERWESLKEESRGYWSGIVEKIEPGALYFFRLDGVNERPDPASYYQPDGVHKASRVVDPGFEWTDDGWTGLPLRDYILYELHVGTFSPEGTFDAVIGRLDELRDLGVNALEIMPVAQFPGERNWGYDGVHPFAVQDSYGGPDALKRLVNECHLRGFAVILDVVYNHLGPEGNYLRDFGPYFTGKYHTPWGEALNFDDAHSDEVRNYFIQNALYWLKYFHFDALRLDAVHAIYDMSATPFLQQLAESVEAFRRQGNWRRYLIAESDLNDSRLIRPREVWGYGLDAQWSDDFHHSLHSLLTGERDGYYADFGDAGHLVKAIREGFTYTGEYSFYRKRRHGNFAADIPTAQFVVAAQNHDQIGNRMLGDRLSTLVSHEGRKLAAGAVMLSPYIPLLFMGEEYGEQSPFLYFVSHTDPDLVEAVRAGRKEEFKSFEWGVEPPDPQSIETFLKSKLNWWKRKEGSGRSLLHFYSTLISMRKTIPALAAMDRGHVDVQLAADTNVIALKRWWDGSMVLCLFNFNPEDVPLRLVKIHTEGMWHRVLDSSDRLWEGPGTMLPDDIDSNDMVTLRAHSVAILEEKL